jgi:hypothetical protein
VIVRQHLRAKLAGQAINGLAVRRGRLLLSHARSCLAAASWRQAQAHGLGCSPAAPPLRGSASARAAVRSGRRLHSREAAGCFDGCLTTTCTGAAEARFTWLLVRPFGGPVMSGVRSQPMLIINLLIPRLKKGSNLPHPHHSDLCTRCRLKTRFYKACIKSLLSLFFC